MRDFVGEIGDYARSFDPSFIIIPQNGQELITGNGEEDGSPVISYLDAIDGVGREDLFYGYDGDNIPTPTFDRDYMISFLDIAEDNHVEVLVIDYCWTQSYVDDSYSQNSARGYISFAADHRELDNIPSYPEAPYKANSSDISSLSSAQNFLYLINPGQFSDRGSFLSALEGTDFDLLIIDLFFNGQELTSTDVAALKRKDNGAARLVIAYMSIGEAEDYRYYWNPEWEVSPPDWLDEENLYWPGNYKVRYWEPDWQDIIFGNNDSYCKKIIDSGFNGAYLDIIDAFEYFENR
ncbi:MAG: endo alpha-1,4 polygalactosaminidase [Candidatus Glassbacteria bacterium]